MSLWSVHICLMESNMFVKVEKTLVLVRHSGVALVQ